MLAVFVIWRRMLLTAWIASRSETDTARLLGTDYIEGSVAIGGGDPMVPRIAMMKALYGHRPKATHASKISSCIVAGRGQ
jgi:hypothetical protein